MPRNPNKRRCTVPGCNAWAMRESEPPRCSAHSGRVGAPEGNQNRLTHGFYSTAVHPEELVDLGTYARNGTLLAEIAIARIALRRVFAMLLSGHTPGTNPRPLEARDYARFVGLAFRGAGAIAHLLRANHAMGGNRPSEFEKAMEAALDAFSAQQGVQL